eukprot:tig00020961_g16709.t1
MSVSLDELVALTREALALRGLTNEEVDIVSETLIWAQLRGNTQGIAKLAAKGGVGAISPSPHAKPMRFERETKLSALINGEQNLGFVVMRRATDVAIEKAKAHGMAIVGTRNTCTGTGAIGFYCERMARAGLIGFAFSSCSELMCAEGSYERIFGTNPLAIGFPTCLPGAADLAEEEGEGEGEGGAGLGGPGSGEDPVVLDLAASATSYYGLVEAQAAGRALPDGIAFDEAGRPTTDPAAARRGALRPFGAHKGSGLAFAVEALCGPLVGASFATLADPHSNWGNLVLAVDPELLWEPSAFCAALRRMVRRVKAAKRVEGVDEIFVPGERGYRRARAARAANAVPMDPAIVRQLRENVAAWRAQREAAPQARPAPPPA